MVKTAVAVAKAMSVAIMAAVEYSGVTGVVLGEVWVVGELDPDVPAVTVSAVSWWSMLLAFCPEAGWSARSVRKFKFADPALRTLKVRVTMVPLPLKLGVDEPTD
jgi:hypothetical protein